eukprot:GHVR01174923.1.p1 GENE.GHVR01174923.1~~GHVR01174923.1.p1  ORF type:complete len:802 (+),score=146.57 GHVR01174923.1:414-2819(+)
MSQYTTYGMFRYPPPCDAIIDYDNGIYDVYWRPPDNNVHWPDPPCSPCSKSPKQHRLTEDNRTLRGYPLLYAKRPVPSVKCFVNDLRTLMSAAQNPVVKTFSFKRVKFLQDKFSMHIMFNSVGEIEDGKDNRHRDFYNVRKVDTHIHHSACMHQKHLLRFIRKKYFDEADTVVKTKSDGTELKLVDIFMQELGFTAHEASVNHLNVHALASCFQRFDLFNDKYNPFGQKLLREVFLKTDNFIEGRYLAELTKEVMGQLVESKYQFAEWRISIYGKSKDEWSSLARWFRIHNVQCKQVRWLIQVPRLYHVYKGIGVLDNFGDMLRNIFEPLFEAVKNPQAHEDIWYLITQVVGFDSVDDESVGSNNTQGGLLPDPDDWCTEHNPPYSYWLYYMYANIRTLSEFLIARGYKHLAFRPHSGEAGSISHLATSYLLADSINHGIKLKKSPVLQYLFYLRQIGLAVSPLSNNALFVELHKSPFYNFFKMGMNVSLSTDDPLMFHFTDEPLLEEYSIAAHTWKLSPVDLCELARNSVLQSGFEPQLKRHWLGNNYKLPGKAGNSPLHTNVPNGRLQYRWDTLQEEIRHLLTVFVLAENPLSRAGVTPGELKLDIPSYFGNMHIPFNAFRRDTYAKIIERDSELESVSSAQRSPTLAKGPTSPEMPNFNPSASPYMLPLTALPTVKDSKVVVYEDSIPRINVIGHSNTTNSLLRTLERCNADWQSMVHSQDEAVPADVFSKICHEINLDSDDGSEQDNDEDEDGEDEGSETPIADDTSGIQYSINGIASDSVMTHNKFFLMENEINDD